MRVLEKTLFIIGLIGLIFNLLNYPGAGVLLVIATTILSLIYSIFSFCLLNNIKLRNAFKKESYINVNSSKIIISVLCGFILSIGCLGILFKIQMFPGATIINMVSILPLVLITIYAVASYFNGNKSLFPMATRTAVVTIFSLIFYLLPTQTWLEIKFANDPQVIKTYKEHKANPNDRDALRRYEEARMNHK